MPTSTISLPDGTSWTLAWDASPSSTTSAVEATALTTTPLDAPPVEPASVEQPTEQDVQAALAKVPPKWTATFWRFAKTLLAGMAAAFGVAWATTGGTLEGVVRDPQAFLVALGTAVLMAAQKALSWKE